MNTKTTMAASAIFLGLIGITLTFAPDEFTKYAGLGYTAASLLVLQILGALYFSFAVLNWMAKGVIIGGIYAKPISWANFAHFAIVAISLFKGFHGVDAHYYPVYIFTGIYIVFAVLFGLITFGHPVVKNTN